MQTNGVVTGGPTVFRREFVAGSFATLACLNSIKAASSTLEYLLDMKTPVSTGPISSGGPGRHGGNVRYPDTLTRAAVTLFSGAHRNMKNIMLVVPSGDWLAADLSEGRWSLEVDLRHLPRGPHPFRLYGWDSKNQNIPFT